jgi:hypothetical protein
VILLSLVLVLLSLGLLIGGLAGASAALVWASIVASLLAGGCLVLAVVRRPRASESVLDTAAAPGSTGSTRPAAGGRPAASTTGGTAGAKDPVEAAGSEVAGSEVAGSEAYPDPADEPAEEDVSAPTVLAVVDLDAEVIVVDGRPRYHLVDCPHLAGRETVPLPVAEARESGFTPCSLCKPDATLVARASAEATEIVEVDEPAAPVAPSAPAAGPERAVPQPSAAPDGVEAAENDEATGANRG